MIGEFADRPSSLDGRKLAFLDCGKRGGEPILKGIANRLSSVHQFEAAFFKKSSAHSCASKKLIDEMVAAYDGIVYGVVN